MYLTEMDQIFLPLAMRQRGGFMDATEWYFGWRPLPYQYLFHQLPVMNVTWKAGVGTGKTTTATASGIIDCISTPDFSLLTTSVTAKQAELTFQAFMRWYESNPKLEHHVKDIVRKPYPNISFVNGSNWSIRTAGDNGDNIRGDEHSRIIFDEPNLDVNGNIIVVLRTRLRGKNRYGVKRMGRLDCIGTPSDILWWQDRYKKGLPGSDLYDPRFYFSMGTTTYENTHLDPIQIAAMEAELTEEQINVEMKGIDPNYGKTFLPSGHINACAKQYINDLLYKNVYEKEHPTAGYILEEHPRHGMIKYQIPPRRDENTRYVMAGDPGTDDPPKRNAGVVAVLEVAPDHNPRIVYFDWVFGHGSYNPFLLSYKQAITTYNPVVRFVDTTSTQKGIAELGFENFGIAVDHLNFSTDKWTCLNSLSDAITSQKMEYPVSKGILRQLGSFSRENADDKSFPQDIVMTFAMLAQALRMMGDREYSNDSEDGPMYSKHTRGARTRRGRSR